jgi:phosphopantothenoylcysteine decarboxylase/phosphopantothenate--cysteine ligase
MARKLKSAVADRGVVAKSRNLDGRHLAVGVSGGIGAVEVIKIIRELRRHGARVTPYLTPSVRDFVTPLSLEWAAGEKAIEILGPEVDHLESHDLVIVAPLTLNTLAKCALGLADNPVTLLVASQLGRRGPCLLVPTMNVQLRNHPLYPEYSRRLEGWGAKLFESPVEEDRLKMPAPDKLVQAIIEVLK